ncbi:GNAT family N-acetyltransferase [Yinghuangia soli]|uniref:GNAT family N-acetyltransferase n=1 Tax=Yinghuangia soli TaxID=2908204 RepID=A0AA41PZ70_9ACTN|nr:GNAT family N-acetyltransferase [Yinghuangia soli]MCF2527529.1 GNAT family N-acetyltransferase [Yinghuangia soli]
MLIRTAAGPDLARLQDIERSAGACFRDIGMPEVADDAPPGTDELAAYAKAGRAWVAVPDGSPEPAAYLIAEEIDGNLHIEQVSVHADHARQGLGRALIDHAAEHAAAHGLPALTLTTFRDVPWNAPYYTRLGFRPLADDELGPGLRRIRTAEAAHGLDRWPRTTMIRPL